MLVAAPVISKPSPVYSITEKLRQRMFFEEPLTVNPPVNFTPPRPKIVRFVLSFIVTFDAYVPLSTRIILLFPMAAASSSELLTVTRV